MSDLILVTFKGKHTADEVLIKLKQMDLEWDIDLEEAAVVTRDEEGKVRVSESTDLAAGGFVGGSLSGGLRGLLIGTILANPALGLIVGGSIGSASGLLGGALAEDEFVKRVDSSLEADSSALAFIAWSGRPEKLLGELGNFKGEVIETNLPVDDEKKLREALASEAKVRVTF